ncbi:hypothetical protein M427DRAFT_57132, partial [Gonapodya prolifera JEL478]
MAASTIILACLLLGENVPFEVSVAPSSSVDSLKEAIKAKLTPKLSEIAANDLELWKVDVPYAARASITEDTLKEADAMGPLDEISEYFQLPPPKKHIHVVVRRPRESQRPTLPSDSSGIALAQRIEELQHKLEEKIQEGQSELQQKLAEGQSELRRLVQAEESVSLSKFDLKKTAFVVMAFPEQPASDDDEHKSIPSFPWETSVTESHSTHREAYMAHLRNILRLPPSGYVTLSDVSHYRSLLSVTIGDVSVKGTTDLLVAVNAPDPCMIVSGALCALEVKKVGETASGIDQACGELLALARIQESVNGKPFVVLTDLVDSWTFFWLSRHSPRTGELLRTPCIAAQKLDRIAAISALLRELDDYRWGYGRIYDTRASKRRRSDESEDDDEDGNGGVGRRGGKSGGAPGPWWRSFTERVSIKVSKPAADSSREVEQELFDSDIGFFRDDPDEITSSHENAKKWAMEFIRMGGIVGLG